MKITETDKTCVAQLKLLRKTHQFKQLVMVGYLNLDTQQKYSDFENGKKYFTDEMILKIGDVFHISPLQFVDQQKSFNLSHLLNHEDYFVIENSEDNDIKLMLYKKLFLESKLENVENRLNSLQNNLGFKSKVSSKHKLYVII